MDSINPGLTEDVCKAIHKQFKSAGAVSVMSVVNPAVFKTKIRWTKAQDPLRFSFSKAKAPKWANSVKQFVERIAGKGKVTMELRKFDKGDYTLLYDELKEGKGVFFSLEFASLDESWGGYTSFIEKAELMRIVPQANTLYVVNQSKLKSFVKYINHHAGRSRIALQGVIHASK